MILSYTAVREDDGKSVKQIISREFSLSSRALTRLKNSGGITVNGKAVTVRHILGENDILTLKIDDTPSESITPVNIPLDIIYEDEHILLVNKPLGMPVHPSQGHHCDTLANAVMYRYRGTDFTFRAITRLDGDTTGLVLVARNAVAAQRLTDLMQNGEINKEYAAATVGVPKEKYGTVNAPIARCENSVIKRKVSPDGKSAVTHYELEFISDNGKYALIKATPVTGRTHQIRLHLSHIGIPIYGDFLYGEPVDNVRAHLHCRRLSFPHPMTGKIMTFEAPLPEDIRKILGL